MATINEYATIGDVARKARAHVNSVAYAAVRLELIVGRLGNYRLVRAEDVPRLIEEVQRHQRPVKQRA